MKRRALPSLSSIITLGLAACTAPAADGFTSYDAPPTATATASSTGEAPVDPSSATSLPVPTTTAAPGSTSVGGETSDTTGPVDPLAPAIVGHAFGPNPLVDAGGIFATIATANADGVRMQIDEGDAIDLELAEPDSFHGQLTYYTAPDLQKHTATFVAWRDALKSAPLVIPFTVALDAPGSESGWDSDSAPGNGKVVALALTPSEDVIELGTYFDMGQPRCYLRRRDLGGAWDPADLFKNYILPDTVCSATDLAVDADGAVYVLADKLENGELRWWLGRIGSWGAPPTNLGTGAPGEVANALASDLTRVAVCGTKPVGTDIDAAAWIFTPNKPGKILSFDYVPAGQLPNSVRETVRDCVFTFFPKPLLALAGHAWGPHDLDNVYRDRHFILELDLAANQPRWIVAEADSGPHSQAHAITVDPQGRYFTGGQSCDEACTKVNSEFRMFLPTEKQIWHRLAAPAIAPIRDIAWSPAGYFVFASAENLGPNDTSFVVQAWVPLHGAPLWTYYRHDAPTVQSADALAIGPYGQVYAGGMGAGGFSALATIAP